MDPRFRIPRTDLRRTRPIGEPYRPPYQPPKKVKTDWQQVGSVSMWSIWIGFLLVLAVGIIALFGPLAGFGIILVFIGKLKIR